MLTLSVLLVGLPSWADPLAPREAAALTTRLLGGKVWLVHAVIDGDTVVVNMDLGWHTWRHDEHVRLNGIDAPERTDLVRWAEAKAFVERLLQAGAEVLLVSGKLGRTLGRLLLRDGRDIRVASDRETGSTSPSVASGTSNHFPRSRFPHDLDLYRRSIDAYLMR
jgi:hypothetical protein